MSKSKIKVILDTQGCGRFFVFLLALSILVCGNLHGDPVENLVRSYMKENNIPGLALAIVKGDTSQIITLGAADAKSGAPVTPYTLFRIASITKVFTGLELALQSNRGRMGLSDPIVKYIPQLKPFHGPIGQITLLQLATHSSGLPRGFHNLNTLPQIFQRLNKWRPNPHIEQQYLYSNLGFGLLGLSIANSENAGYMQVIQRDILNPLNMSSTTIQQTPSPPEGLAVGYKPDGKVAPSIQAGPLPGGGALISNAADMLKFLKANLGQNISEELYKAVQTSHKGYYRPNNKLVMGLGWQKVNLEGNILLDKNGGLSGFSSYIGFVPSKQVGVVILANKSKINSTLLGRRIIKLLLEDMPKKFQ